MSRIESQVNRRDDDFVTRDRHHRELAQALRDTLEQTALGGAQKYRDRHVARGKLLPRERVRTLLDPGSPFLEVAPLAAHGMYNNNAPGAGVIAGVGRVNGTECMVVANEETVRGGAYYPKPVNTHLRAYEIDLEYQ